VIYQGILRGRFKDSRICGREMASIHQAAKDGQLDECRRLVEKEGKDVNEKDEVSGWLVGCLVV
jgi:hypothetical protein